MNEAEAIFYEKFINSQIRPYSSESIGVNLFEIVYMNNLKHDQDFSNIAIFEYESCDEPVRPKIDRWTTRNCPVKTVEKIEYSDFDITDAQMFKLNIGNEMGSSPGKQTDSGFSFTSKVSMKSSIKSSGGKSSIRGSKIGSMMGSMKVIPGSKFKNTQVSRKDSSKTNTVRKNSFYTKNVDSEECKPVELELEFQPVPLNDIEPPRKIPIEEKILRDRKEKQKANEQRMAEELAEREEREAKAKRNIQPTNKQDYKNK